MKSIVTGFLLALSMLLAACEPVSMTMLGVGAGTGTAYTMNGMVYRTFSEPLPKIRAAATQALKHMGISVKGSKKVKEGEVITAVTADREIEVLLEAISTKATRMRCIARSGVVVDSATAMEIVIQTERVVFGKG